MHLPIMGQYREKNERYEKLLVWNATEREMDLMHFCDIEPLSPELPESQPLILANRRRTD